MDRSSHQRKPKPDSPRLIARAAPKKLPLTWDEKCVAIEAAFRRLQNIDSNSAGLPMLLLENQTHFLARTLSQMVGGPPPAQLNKDALKSLNLHASRLSETLDSLGPEAAALLNFRDDAFKHLCMGVRLLAISSQTPPPSRKGAPNKADAQRVADFVGEIYCVLTGNKNASVTIDPTDNRTKGPFVNLLTEIFSIIGIDASAASQAKKIKKTINRRKSGH